MTMPNDPVAMPHKSTFGMVDPNSAAKYRPPNFLLLFISAVFDTGGEKYCDIATRRRSGVSTWNPSWRSFVTLETLAKDKAASSSLGITISSLSGTVGSSVSGLQTITPTPVKSSPAKVLARPSISTNSLTMTTSLHFTSSHDTILACGPTPMPARDRKRS